MTGACTITIALLHTKYNKLNLATTIALPITFLLGSLILGTIGFFCGEYSTDDLKKQNKNDQKECNEYKLLYATLVNFFPVLLIGLLIDKSIELGTYLCRVVVEKFQGRDSCKQSYDL